MNLRELPSPSHSRLLFSKVQFSPWRLLLCHLSLWVYLCSSIPLLLFRLLFLHLSQFWPVHFLANHLRHFSRPILLNISSKLSIILNSLIIIPVCQITGMLTLQQSIKLWCSNWSNSPSSELIWLEPFLNLMALQILKSLSSPSMNS